MVKRGLGVNQRAMLGSLKDHKGWSRGCGWIWSTNGETEKILESLVKRGLVVKEATTTFRGYPSTRYVLTEAGKEAL